MTTRNGLTGGAAAADITPDRGIQLVGYPYLPRENTGVHDRLYATCLFLDDGLTKIMMIHADLCYLEKQTARDIRGIISKKLSIPVSCIMLSCSHTHSGPRTATRLSASDVASGMKVESAYLEKLSDQLVELAQQATTRPRKLAIGFGRGNVGSEKGIGGNRHKPDGIADPSLGVIGVLDADEPGGQWLAVWVRYSLHPTILQADNTQVSADYPGYVRNYIRSVFPNAVMMFAQGATGDQSSRFFRNTQTFDEARRFGYEMGREAVRMLSVMQTSTDVRLCAASAEVEPVWRVLPSLDEIRHEAEELGRRCQELEQDEAPYAERQTCYLNRLGAEYTLSFIKERERGVKHPWEYEQPLEIQLFKIGDSCVMGIQGEIFAEFTLKIESFSPFAYTFTVTLANGVSPGYIVSAEAAKNKVFESGTSLITPDTGDKIIEAAAGLYGKVCGCAALEEAR